MRLYCGGCRGGMEHQPGQDACGWCTGDGWFTARDVLVDLVRDLGAVLRTARHRVFGWSRAERARIDALEASLVQHGIRVVRPTRPGQWPGADAGGQA